MVIYAPSSPTTTMVAHERVATTSAALVLAWMAQAHATNAT
jgi:hypothetical protein